MIKLRTVGVVLTAVLALSACGDDDPVADAADRGADLEPADSADGSSDDGLAGGELSSDECLAVAEAFSAPLAAFSGVEDSDFEVLAEALAESARRVPAEIQDDLEFLADAVGDLATELNDLEIDFSDPSSMTPERLAEFERLAETFGSAEYETAAQNVSDYLDEVCGTDIAALDDAAATLGEDSLLAWGECPIDAAQVSAAVSLDMIEEGDCRFTQGGVQVITMHVQGGGDSVDSRGFFEDMGSEVSDLDSADGGFIATRELEAHAEADFGDLTLTIDMSGFDVDRAGWESLATSLIDAVQAANGG